MNPELVLKFMSQDVPWSFGLRHTIVETPEAVKAAPLDEYPFFARLGPPDQQFQVIGSDLESCLQWAIEHATDYMIQLPPA